MHFKLEIILIKYLLLKHDNGLIS